MAKPRNTRKLTPTSSRPYGSAASIHRGIGGTTMRSRIWLWPTELRVRLVRIIRHPYPCAESTVFASSYRAVASWRKGDTLPGRHSALVYVARCGEHEASRGLWSDRVELATHRRFAEGSP